jgi:hypothetical protein
MIQNRSLRLIPALILLLFAAGGCSDDLPIDEDGLLITNRGECYVSNFNLLGSDFQTVLFAGTTADPNPEIDTVAQTINVDVVFGTDLTNVFPQFTLVTDAKLDPKIVGKVDMSDLSNPKQWTVISGNRKVAKTYTVNITVRP